MQILDGRATSNVLKDKLAEKVKALISSGARAPHLAAILVGDDGASQTYVAAKVKACERVGFNSTLVKLPAATSQKELLQKVEELNNDSNVDGFIVQLPLPGHLDSQLILEAVAPEKDVDGFHPSNVGKMVLGLPTFLPATPYGIVQLLEHYEVPTEGKHCVIIGRSNIVGKPMSILMSRNAYPGNCTVTLTHSRTKEMREICKSADILIVALGKAEFVKGDMVKEGACVIDVGITRVNDESKKSGYRLVGDVLFEEVAPKCSFITPVPGGVGPMTIVSLLANTYQASTLHQTISV